MAATPDHEDGLFGEIVNVILNASASIGSEMGDLVSWIIWCRDDDDDDDNGDDDDGDGDNDCQCYPQCIRVHRVWDGRSGQLDHMMMGIMVMMMMIMIVNVILNASALGLGEFGRKG